MNQQQQQFNIILIGDDCIDEYKFVEVDRISPEAPVPVCREVDSYIKPGMSSNVLMNLANLGCGVRTYMGKPSTKTRIIDRRSNQHIIRLDEDVRSEPLDPRHIDFTKCDAVVISDYDKGFLTYENIRRIIATARGKPIFIDTKKTDLKKFNGAYVKINQQEYNKATSYAREMIVTRGGDRIEYNDEIFEIPPIDVVDVCGAGDTFLATLAVKFLETRSIEKAIPYAIIASSITVRHAGVYAPSRKEIESLLLK